MQWDMTPTHVFHAYDIIMIFQGLTFSIHKGVQICKECEEACGQIININKLYL